MVMKVRPAAGMGMTIDEAMARVFEIKDRPGLIAYLKENFYWWGPTDTNVTIEHYGFDERIGWDTYLISVNGNAALFADRGDFENENESSSVRGIERGGPES